MRGDLSDKQPLVLNGEEVGHEHHVSPRRNRVVTWGEVRMTDCTTSVTRPPEHEASGDKCGRHCTTDQYLGRHILSPLSDLVFKLAKT